MQFLLQEEEHWQNPQSPDQTDSQEGSQVSALWQRIRRKDIHHYEVQRRQVFLDSRADPGWSLPREEDQSQKWIGGAAQYLGHRRRRKI